MCEYRGCCGYWGYRGYCGYREPMETKTKGTGEP